MAVWQFELALQPNGTGAVPQSVGDEHPGAGPGTLFQHGDADVIRAIDGILPRRDSWSEDLMFWGEESGNRIHAVLEGGKIAEVTARIDLRQPWGTFVEQIIGIARYCDAHFRTADESDIPAEKARVLDAIRHSEAFRFVGDPHRFFDGLPSGQ
jgi:hypothetical protein